MKTLLPIDSPKYLRRLVKEVNLRLISGMPVYCLNQKTNNRERVRFITKYNKENNCVSIGNNRFLGVTFDNGVEEIVASREN